MAMTMELTPHRPQRRLVAQLSLESVGDCVLPPPEKRRRLKLLFSPRSLADEFEPKLHAKAEAALDAESWERTSTTVPDSDGEDAFPKSIDSMASSPLHVDVVHEEGSDGSCCSEGEEEDEEEDDESRYEETEACEEEHQQQLEEEREKVVLHLRAESSERPAPAAAATLESRSRDIDILRTCSRARDIIRGTADLPQQVSLRAHALACHFVHVATSQSSSGAQPLSFEDQEVSAAEAAEVALEACVVEGACSKRVGGRVSSSPPLPLDFIEEVLQEFVGRLPLSEAFRDYVDIAGEPPHAAALALAPALAEVARKFCTDASMSEEVALRREPRAVASASLALAACLIFKDRSIQVPADDIFASLAGEAGGLAQLRRCTKDITEVFRLWRDFHRRCDVSPRADANSGSAPAQAPELRA
mmetsp:Transcript_43925/g.125710  ORF Transcript_43925/g.125710 Transcript_43925/m.125710 type:complete len:418 (+) Transcript_43925:92-1345(+)